MDGPFAVINADDYYGVEAFKVIYDYLSTHADDDKYRYAMVGYEVGKTVTDNGYVSRGVCEVNENQELISVTERTRIVNDKVNCRLWGCPHGQWRACGLVRHPTPLGGQPDTKDYF